ncbi:methyl-accepting chemotaxis sensory transducer with Pas/Pac sensor [Tranquillimonas rosea]|uniref:Methyl-accepting chemotaxis sensory transducer with Pas/Pac sensor n=1 Tax=Tranquillimonas rosea TaxID=641238 RepID=A0A1H9VCX9_9RHOB|nr:PAS domain S-box protein [Tranquillimonas rosea]SES19411.1 methyl-accepting chemotaxis sensory transducer with Pas/Pac sensor [Tranquillimonas rosea]
MRLFTKSSVSDAVREALEVHAALEKVQAMISFDLDGTILDANENFLRAFGYTIDEIRGQHHRVFVEPAHAISTAYKDFWQKLSRGEFVRGEFARIGKDGRTVWIEASYNPVIDKSGEVVKIIEFAIDVTAAKLRAAEAASQLEAISKSLAVIEFDLDGTILTANENFLDLMDYSLAELQGQHHRMFVEPSDAASSDYVTFWSDLRAGRFRSGEFKRLGRGGRPVWIQASYNPILDPSGRPIKVVKFASDITEVKLKAADASGQLEAISKSQAVIEFDLNGTIRTANDNFLQTLGYTLGEIKGQHHRMFVETEFAQSSEYSAFWQSLGRGEFQTAEYKRIGKGGREVWIQASYNPIFDPSGKPYKVVKYATDITPRRRAVEAISAGLARLSHGDLSARVTESVAGDFESLRTSFNETMVRLEELVNGILEASIAIADETDGIAASAKDLATRGETQAGTLEEISAAMEEISANVKSTAANSDTATTAAKTAFSNAETGCAVVNDAIAAMGRIEKSSAEISNIIEVIDSIAFQTNLLALNAGVEAARAGDAGKGFAVVASEVRALAQRASGAAREINELIEKSGKEVGNGSSLINQSGKALGEIVAAVDSVVESISDISTASREQTKSIVEVTEAVTNIDQTTQHTAAIAEESSAAALQLAERTANLRDLVSFFQAAGNAPHPKTHNIHRLPASKATVLAPPSSRAPKRVVTAASKRIADREAEA